jgi:hypothetical protein
VIRAYRCYVIASDDKIMKTLIGEHITDDDAILWAKNLLVDNPRWPVVEIWDRARCVHRAQRHR